MSNTTYLFSLEGDATGAVALIDEVMASLDELEGSIASVAGSADSLTALDGQLGTLAASAGSLPDVFAGLADALAALAEKAQAATESLGSLGADADTTAGQLGALSGSADTAAGSLDAVGASGGRAKGGLRGAAESSDGLAKSFDKVKLPLLVAGAAITGVSVVAVRMAGDFQESMTQLETGAGESASNISLVSNSILAMAPKLGETTSQLAQGMYMIESAGYHGQAGLNVLQAAAEGARVGAADLGTVADATTTIMNDFGATGVSASNAVNALIATVANGKTHMQDLGQSLAQILPTAAAANVGLYDVLGAMATMTGEGVPAANAATYLRQTIIALTAPSVAARKALNSVGLTTQQVAQQMQRSLPGAVQMITDAVAKKFPPGSAAYVAALKDISGGSKTMQGMLDLSGARLATFQQNVKAVTAQVKEGGNSIQGWSVTQEDFNTKMARAGAAVQVAMIKIGQALMPVAEALVARLMPALTNFSAWAATNGPQLVRIIEVAAAAIGGGLVTALVAAAIAMSPLTLAAVGITAAVAGVSAGVVLLIQHWQQIVGFFQASTGPAIAVKAIIAGLGGAVLAFAASQIPALITALMASVPAWIAQATAAGAAAVATLAAAAPFILIGIAIAAVVAGILLLVTHWKQVSDAIGAFLGGAGKAIGDFFNGLGTWINGALSGLGDTIAQFFGQVKGWAEQHLEAAKVAIIQKWQGIQQGFQDALTGIQNLVKAGFQLVLAIITAPIRGIEALFLWLFNHNYYFRDMVLAIVGFFTQLKADAVAIWNGIVSFIVGLWNGIVSTARTLWRDLTTIISSELTLAQTIATTVWNAILSFLTTVWNTVKTVATTAWNLILTIIRDDLALAQSIITTVWNAVTGFLGGIWRGIQNAASSAWNGLVGIVQSFVGSAGNAAKSVGNAILTPIQTMGNMLFNAGKNLIQMLINGIGSMLGAVGNAVGNIAGKIKSVLGFHSPAEEGPGSTADEWMPNLGTMLASGLLAQQAKVAQAARAIAASIARSLAIAANPTLSISGATGAGSLPAMPATAAAGAMSMGAAAGPIGALGVGGAANGLMTNSLLMQLIQAVQQQAQNAQPLGSSPVLAQLGSVTQQFGSLNVNGVQDLQSLYTALNTLAGYAIENSRRGATAGMAV
ncbi:MAG: phage tail tape measure protein [Ktedonobacterales bacterium]|nr:phage tail tape measure protein [Ktedonobacterales bacterium]